MIADADDIDARDPPWGIPANLGGSAPPPTLGSFLRAFTHGNVRQR
jgi:hypothetical protein